jgi:hypothetical protein
MTMYKLIMQLSTVVALAALSSALPFELLTISSIHGLEPRKEALTFTQTPDAKKLCDITTLDSDPDAGTPLLFDCLELLYTLNRTNGYWTGTEWPKDGSFYAVESYQSCTLIMRSMNINMAPISFGNRDMFDAIEQSVSMYNNGTMLPTTYGTTWCNGPGSGSGGPIEWIMRTAE